MELIIKLQKTIETTYSLMNFPPISSSSKTPSESLPTVVLAFTFANVGQHFSHKKIFLGF